MLIAGFDYLSFNFGGFSKFWGDPEIPDDRCLTIQPRFQSPLPRKWTLVRAGHVTVHDKLLPSRGTLTLLFYSQEPIRDFQAGTTDLSKRNGRDLAQFHAVYKNRILSRI